MNTVEFIKKFGWDAINHDLSGYFKGENIEKIQVLTKENEYIEIDGDDLEQLVESYDLVESCGGLQSVKDTFNFAWSHGAAELTEYGERVKQAITDVESCK